MQNDLILVTVLYQASMGYALLTLGSFWAFPAVRGRRVPDLSLMVFGLAIPLAGWFFSNITPWACILIPGSMAYMYLYESRDSKKGKRALEAQLDAHLAECNRMIEADPNNAAAHQLRAEILERQAAAQAPEKRQGLNDIFDGILLLVGLIVLIWRWHWGLNLVSLALFIFWYRRGGSHH